MLNQTPAQDQRLASGERGSDDFLSAVLRATPECIKVVARDGRLLQMNDAGLAMIGASDFGQVYEADTFNLVAPEDRARWVEMHRRVCSGERLAWTFDIIGLGGVRRHMETHATPIALPGGETAQLAVTRDVSARRAAEEQQRLLINELNHRVKNTLAIVQGLARRSLRGRAPRAALDEYENRLAAMAAAHDVLTARGWLDAPVRDLVRAALAPFEAHGAIRLDGPELTLPPSHSVTLAMVLHELATNAAKHGALSVSEGRLEVSWRRDGAVCELLWREHDGPSGAPPRREGFGFSLLRRAFGPGAVSLCFEPAGLFCTVRAPLEPAPSQL